MPATCAEHAADEHADNGKGAQAPLLSPWNIVSIELHELIKGVWSLYLPLADRVTAPQIFAYDQKNRNLCARTDATRQDVGYREDIQ